MKGLGVANRFQNLSAGQSRLLASFGSLILILSLVMGSFNIGEISASEPVEHSSSISVEKVFTLANESASTTNETYFTLDVFVFLTNGGLKDTTDVRIDAYALESSSGLGRSNSNTVLGNLPAQTSQVGIVQLVIPRNTTYDIELLIWKEGKVVITAAATVTVASESSETGASSSTYKVDGDEASWDSGDLEYGTDSATRSMSIDLFGDAEFVGCMLWLLGILFFIGLLINLNNRYETSKVVPKTVFPPVKLRVPSMNLMKAIAGLGVLLILSSIWLSAFVDEPEKMARPEGGPHLNVVNVFPLVTPLADNESTLSLQVILTNEGDEDTESVELRAFAVESTSGIAKAEATTVVLNSEAEKTSMADLDMVIPDGQRYVIWLLATKEDKVVLHGKRTIVSVGGSGSAQAWSTVKADQQGSPRALALWASTPDPEPWNVIGISKENFSDTILLAGLAMLGGILGLMMLHPDNIRGDEEEEKATPELESDVDE